MALRPSAIYLRHRYGIHQHHTSRAVRQRDQCGLPASCGSWGSSRFPCAWRPQEGILLALALRDHRSLLCGLSSVQPRHRRGSLLRCRYLGRGGSHTERNRQSLQGDLAWDGQWRLPHPSLKRTRALSHPHGEIRGGFLFGLHFPSV